MCTHETSGGRTGCRSWTLDGCTRIDYFLLGRFSVLVDSGPRGLIMLKSGGYSLVAKTLTQVCVHARVPAPRGGVSEVTGGRARGAEEAAWACTARKGN